jgi:hypothetical protein
MIQIVGDPDNQRPDKWTSTVLSFPPATLIPYTSPSNTTN